MRVELNDDSIKTINRLLQSLPISTLPIVEKITQEIFALDIHPKISKESLDENIEIMKKISEN